MAEQGEGWGTHDGQSEPIAECGLVRDEREVERSSSPELSVDSSVVLLHYSPPFPMKRENAAPPSHCLGHAVGLTPEEMLVLPLNGRKHLPPLPF